MTCQTRKHTIGTKLKYDAIMVVYFINEETRKTAIFSNFDTIIVVGFGQSCLRLIYIHLVMLYHFTILCLCIITKHTFKKK